jgi:predicted DNA-binding protein YlxM (UPF0122 family)
MNDEDYNKHLEIFDSYINVKKKALSDTVSSLGNVIIEEYLEDLKVQEKIEERNEKIDNLLNEK